MITGQPEKLNGKSMDISAENRAKIKQLFPTVFTEIKNDKGETVEAIDFEKLKAELGTFTELFESRRERYGMDWPGKKEALKLIQTPGNGTLKPCREESVNFDTTENLYIEGDNLEVLKLLQKSYYGKVKMIYIDPPYNTGKEFIYPDNYSESLETYLEYAGLIDGDGKKFSTNTANEGRFHTKWLNMMYPRLYLARNLLRDDGVIFISIDDNEVSNLRKMCDEIFGEDNFVSIISVQSNPRGRQSDTHIASVHDYLIVYVKNISSANFLGAPLTEEQKADFKYIDSRGEAYRLLGLRQRGSASKRSERPDMFFPIYVNSNTHEISLEVKTGWDAVYPRKSDGTDGRWMWGKEKCKRDLEFLVARLIEQRNEYDIFVKDYLNRGDIERTRKFKSIWEAKEYNNQAGTQEVKSLLNCDAMSFPKPKDLLKTMCQMGLNPSDLILDFFSGSATTAHAVLDLNNQDGGNRKFIMVQLPEPCAEDSEAFKAGYKTIADIGKERICRVIKKLNNEQEGKLDFDNSSKQDRGFKVFKLDKSNFRQWQALTPDTPPEKIAEQLELHINHISLEATQEDLLYEILIKAGFTPVEKVEQKTIAGKKIFSVADGGLLICLEDTVTKELIDAIAEAEPLQFICLDHAFNGNDQLKANTVQTFAARNIQKEKHNQIVFRTI